MGLQIVKFTADVTIKQLLRKTLTFYRGVIPSCANLTPHEDRTLSRVQQWFLNFSLPRKLGGTLFRLKTFHVSEPAKGSRTPHWESTPPGEARPPSVKNR